MTAPRLLGVVLLALGLFLAASPTYLRVKGALHGAGLPGEAAGFLTLGTVTLLLAFGGWLVLRGYRSF